MRLAGLAPLLTAACVTACGESSSQPGPERRPDHDAAIAATRTWLASLDDSQRAKATFAFEDEERRSWRCVASERKGLALGAMSETQRLAAEEALIRAFSAGHYHPIRRVMAQERERASGDADPEHGAPDHHLSVFGVPDDSAPWGLRFEGPHVSVNLTFVDRERVAFLPFFIGASPDHVPGARDIGFGALGQLTGASRGFLAGLSDAQRAEAAVVGSIPREVVFGPGTNPPDVASGQGITVPFQALMYLLTPVSLLIPRLEPDRLDDLDGQLATARFAFAGGFEPGEPLYWRLEADAWIVEYVNVEDGANHVHFGIRSRTDDFGARLLPASSKSERH